MFAKISIEMGKKCEKTSETVKAVFFAIFINRFNRINMMTFFHGLG
jgi:hypothetical protein